jgi:A/G-specific adenine glycosylase
MTAETAKDIAARIVPWYRANKRDLPWRREPYCKIPYCLFVSEVMLQQTQVNTVIPYWERWMAVFPTVHALAAADEQSVLKAWEGLGYYRRARNLHQAAKLIAAKGGVFPSGFQEILDLPGVGRYTAGAICSIAFGLAVPVLDGNVARVLSRLHARDFSERELWDRARELVQSVPAAASALNQGLMELGATVCTPRQPACPACPVRSHCAACALGRVAEFPKPPARPPVRQRRFAAVILRRGRYVLVRQRDADSVNGNLWEFPSVELSSRKPIRKQLEAFLQHDLPLNLFATLRHTITNNRITLKAYFAEIAEKNLAARVNGLWLPLAEIAALPFSSAHSKLRSLLHAREPRRS